MEEFTALLTYDTTQENISLELIQPIRIESIRFSNAQAEAVKISIYAENQPVPLLLITADTIQKEMKTGSINVLLAGTNEVIMFEKLNITDKLYISYIGTGAGSCALTISANYRPSLPIDLSDELAQVHQVSKDQIGAASAGSEFYAAGKQTTIPKQVGVNPY